MPFCSEDVNSFGWQDRLEKRIKSCKMRLREMEDDEADMPFRESAQEHLDLWKNKQEFYSSLLALDLLPADVPGDGNCALWTICALESGCFVRTKMTTSPKVNALRQDGDYPNWSFFFKCMFK